LGYEADVIRQANTDEIKRRLPCVVILNAGLLIGQAPARWGHYVVVKEVRNGEVIVNDPAPGYGGENVAIDRRTFMSAWQTMDRWLLNLRGDNDDEN